MKTVIHGGGGDGVQELKKKKESSCRIWYSQVQWFLGTVVRSFVLQFVRTYDVHYAFAMTMDHCRCVRNAIGQTKSKSYYKDTRNLDGNIFLPEVLQADSRTLLSRYGGTLRAFKSLHRRRPATTPPPPPDKFRILFYTLFVIGRNILTVSDNRGEKEYTRYECVLSNAR